MTRRFAAVGGLRRAIRDGRGKAGSGGGPQTPATILGSLLHADFDVADPGIVLNTGKVASIPNRGNDTAAMAQATATAQPVYSATSFAGGPGMTFDGTDDTLLCTLASAIPVGRRPYMWVVFKAGNTSLSFQVAAAAYSAAPLAGLVGWSNRADTNTFAVTTDPGGGPSGAGFFATVVDTVNTHLMEVGYTVGGAAAGVIDGVPVDTAAGSSVPIVTAISQIRASGYATALTYPSNCTIRRIIVANDLPSAAQIAAMRAYLRAQPYAFSPQTPVLPTSAVAAWHSEIACAPSAWVDYVGGRSAPGVGTPIVAADPGFFAGRVVAQAKGSPVSGWFYNGTPLITAGTQFWIFAVVRARGAFVENGFVWGLRAGSTNNSGLRTLAVGNFYSEAEAAATNIAASSGVHRIKQWLDGTNLQYRQDGASASSPFAGGTTGNPNKLSLGNVEGALGGDVNIAYFLLCSAKPTAGEEAALDAWAQAYFGAP